MFLSRLVRGDFMGKTTATQDPMAGHQARITGVTAPISPSFLRQRNPGSCHSNDAVSRTFPQEKPRKLLILHGSIQPYCLHALCHRYWHICISPVCHIYMSTHI